MTTREQVVRTPLFDLVALPEPEKSARGLLYTPAEILQQPETWRGTFAGLSAKRSQLAAFLDPLLAKSPTVYLVGAGTSDYIGRALTNLLRQQWRCDVIAIPSTDLITDMASYVIPNRNYLWISFSRSGDSSEGVGVLQAALEDYPQVQHIVISCNERGRMVELCTDRTNAYALVLDDAVNDRSLAMTSSFTNMVVAGHCLAHTHDLAGYGAILETLVCLGDQMLQVGAPIAQAVSELSCRKVCYVGSGALAAAATESGLKTLELTAGTVCPFAETTMGLRHGPMSALDDDTLVVSFISSDDRRRRYDIDLVKEIATKKLGRARVAVTATDAASLESYCDHVIYLDSRSSVPDDYRVPVDVMIGQMIGLFSSIKAGLKPDAPSPSGTISRVVSHVNIYR